MSIIRILMGVSGSAYDGMTQTSDHYMGDSFGGRGWRGGERIIGMVDREGLNDERVYLGTHG